MNNNLTILTINTNKLIKEVNKLYIGNKPDLVEILISDENCIYACKGSTIYDFSFESAKASLEENSHKYGDENSFSDIILKKIVNNLEAPMGYKMYPEIKPVIGDYI